MRIVTIEEAKNLGAKRYFTGEPCIHGHIDERFVSTRQCYACLKAHHKKWKSKNMSKIYAANKRWVQRNMDKVLRNTRRWQEKNKESGTITSRNRRAKKKMVGGAHSQSDINKILQRQSNKCLNCKKSVKDKHHVDHIMPIHLGGSNDKNNLQILCPKCNLKKWCKHPIDWAQENGRLV